MRDGDQTFSENLPGSSRGKTSRASRVSSTIRKAILSGELPPGSKVNLEVFRKKFGISLSPLREAMSRLTTTGLVEFEDQRGYRIAPLTRSNLEEIIRLRAELECLAVATAIDVAGLEWESAVLAALHRLTSKERAGIARRDETLWIDAHHDFHAVLISGCNMPILIDMCVMLQSQAERYRRILIGEGRCGVEVTEEHIAIADAAVGRDRALAVSLVRGHIERAGANLMAAMSEY